LTWPIPTLDNASGMPPEQPRNPLEALQAQLRSALDAHLTGLSQQYEEGVTAARREAAEAAQRALDERLERERAEWTQKLDAELSSARAEADRRVADNTTKARAEAEQQAAESLTRVRAEHETALAAERQRSEHAARERADLEAKWQQADADHQRVRGELDALAKQVQAADADRRRVEQEIEEAQQRSRAELDELRKTVASLRDERQRAHSELESERQRATGEIEQVRREAAAQLQQTRDQAKAQLDELRRHAVEEIEEARREAHEEGRRQAAAEIPAPPPAPGLDRILASLRAIDASRTLSEALEGLLRQASSVAPRVAVFLVNGERLRSWKTAGFPQLDAQPFESAISGSGLLAKALQTGEAIHSGSSQAAPTFAAVPEGRLALAIPVIVGGRTVAVVYADNVGATEGSASWQETIELLARHTSTVLALLTALRTVQTLVASNGEGEEQNARRYAKLLVSEIKLYNEGAVKAGRERRDLLSRLRPEIDRARRMYEERVPAMVGARSQYFHQELVQMLADGDPGLLGTP
jgi:GAF domain